MCDLMWVVSTHAYVCLCMMIYVFLYSPLLFVFLMDDWDLLKSRAETRFRSFAFRATVLDISRRRRWNAAEV